MKNLLYESDIVLHGTSQTELQDRKACKLESTPKEPTLKINAKKTQIKTNTTGNGTIAKSLWTMMNWST